MLTVQIEENIDGVMVSAGFSASAEALLREVGDCEPGQKTAHIPYDLREAMTARLRKEVSAMLVQARPQLLACLAEVVLESYKK